MLEFIYSIKIIALFIFARYGHCSSDGENNGRECNICLSKNINEDELQTLPCRHVFHEKCITPWASDHNTCPTCRAVFPRHVGSIVLLIKDLLVKANQMQIETLANAQHYRNWALASAQTMKYAQKSDEFMQALETAQKIRNDLLRRLMEADAVLNEALQDSDRTLNEAAEHAQRVHDEATVHVEQRRASLQSAKSQALPNAHLLAALENAEHFLIETTANAQNLMSSNSDSERIENESREHADFIYSEAKANVLSTPAEALPNAQGLLDYAERTSERIQSETTAKAARIRNETMAISERIRTETLANAQRIKKEFENALRLANKSENGRNFVVDATVDSGWAAEERELYIDDITLMFFDSLMVVLNAAFPGQQIQYDFFEYEDDDGERLRVRTDEELATFLADLAPNHVHGQPLRIRLKTSRVQRLQSVDFEGDEQPFEPEELRFIERLSDGQFGSVYKSLDTRNDRLIAVKCIAVDGASGTRQGLLNEIAILKRCAHPNIVQFHAALFVDNQLLICMELMDALSLDRYGQLTPPVLGAISVAVIDGLKYLWELHIMHRDIKPSNFLVNSAGQVKLADFGVSKQMAQSVAWSYVGTKVYMAPERLGGDVYSVASDVWSFGISLAEMALGRFPFGPSFASSASTMPNLFIIEALISRPEAIATVISQPELSAVGYGFDELLAGCLALNPKERLGPEKIYHHNFLTSHRPTDQNAVAKFIAQRGKPSKILHCIKLGFSLSNAAIFALFGREKLVGYLNAGNDTKGLDLRVTLCD
uniref:mitogen-activated protein kinase kinase n=1 Tax=Globodera rostochiensis TaxID=31243 RepID=A0A914GPH0_GLORO